MVTPRLSETANNGGAFSPAPGEGKFHAKYRRTRPHRRNAAVRTMIGLLTLGIAWCAVWVAEAAQSEWPLELESPEAKVVVYEPQLETFKGDQATARAAVSVIPAGSGGPVFGAIWFSARTATDRDTRMVAFTEIKVTDVRFPREEPGDKAGLGAFLEREIPRHDLTISLDHMLAMLDLAEREKSVSENIKSDPPKILFETEPAVLVVLDGDPVLRKVEGSDLMRVVNTPYFIVLLPSARTYYLFGGGGWAEASDPMGPWKQAVRVPKTVADLARSESGETGGGEAGKNEAPGGKMPKIIVVTEPTELITTSGEPRYTPIRGTDLLYVSNTKSDVILEIASQRYFVLVSGRWFASASLNGPWSHVPSEQLPPSFRKIPSGSPKSNVLTFVPGTEEAREAVLDAQIPQTAAVNRKEASLQVTYDGAPRFEPIEGTALYYAVNTGDSVLKLGQTYYCCHEGVWFEAASPLGPWAVCVSVPGEIQNIPPSCPLYNVKYVRVYDYTPDVVYVGYTPGYLGCYVYGGAVVYGTGWYYRPWVGAYYYPRPCTWGFHASYNPWNGWGFGFAWGFPGGWFSFGAGGWLRPGGWWGPTRLLHAPPPPPGFRGPRPYYRPANIYHRPPAGAPRPGRPGPGGPVPGKPLQGKPGAAPGHPSLGRVPGGGRGTAAGPRANDVYIDRNGNVYRRGRDGWQMRDRGGWTGGGAGARYGRGPSDLNQQYNARRRGTQRNQSYRSQFPGGPGGWSPGAGKFGGGPGGGRGSQGGGGFGGGPGGGHRGR